MSRHSGRAGVAALALFGAFCLTGCDTQVGLGAEGRGPTKAPLEEMGLIGEEEQPTVMDELGDPNLLPQTAPPAEADPGADVGAEPASDSSPAAGDTAAQ